MSRNFIFKFDPKIKDDFYTSSYYIKTHKIISKCNLNDEVCMQFTFFQEESIKVCGIQEVVELLKFVLGKQIKQINIYGRRDGEIVSPKTPVLLLFGKYKYFVKLENIIDGILARRSSVCNNCYKILKHIKSSQLIFMGERTDDYILQPYDGYCAYIAGVRNFVTDASVSLIKNKKDINVNGTMPHALIQQCDGDLNKALALFKKTFPTSNLIALVDYHNDVPNEIKLISKSFPNLFAIRIDTSKTLIDNSVKKIYGDNKNNYGVNPNLIKLARKTLDQHQMKNTKIIVSSSFDENKIKQFSKLKLPIDYYGVGSFLITRNIHFTADLVLKNNKHCAKYGRKLLISQDKLKNLTKY
jgi:nicotinate phosphoribosyltransferase